MCLPFRIIAATRNIYEAGKITVILFIQALRNTCVVSVRYVSGGSTGNAETLTNRIFSMQKHGKEAIWHE